ncbi:hypothetical protein NMH_0902 [Neisseria meningitidis H44/76]|uniref:Uncharacterized protein n=1 Tax=Neisseria meningitidis serogroup B / serotype 15 (strain H44/76) TaxID=909420 RepID=E6MW64_NEIMH|nr:hypothetical protein NMH_0902 [Neisseria meningitidis H44/76]KER40216.1 hypothetical protein F528_0799 [Neisseria meningitidis 992008]
MLIKMPSENGSLSSDGIGFKPGKPFVSLPFVLPERQSGRW